MENREEKNEERPEEMTDGTKEEERKTKSLRETKPPIIVITVAVVILLVIGFMIYRAKRWVGSGRFYIDTSIDTETETDDRVSVLPADIYRSNDDGVTRIVFFGNDTFGDTSDGPSICRLLQENTTATIYDCTFPGSTMTANSKLLPSESGEPLDLFSLYWLWDCKKNDDLRAQEEAIEIAEGIDKELYREHLKLLNDLDFNDIDYMVIAYDGHDYLMGHAPFYGEDYYTQTCIHGVVYAMSEKIFPYYPEIQVVFVSPSFCYARDEDGNRVSGDLYRINGESLTSGIQYLKDVTQLYGFSYVDDYFGTNINQETAEEYLTKDDVVPNLEGKKLIAAHVLNKLIRRVEVVETDDAK